MVTRLVLLTALFILLVGLGVRQVSISGGPEIAEGAIAQAVSSQDVYIDKKFPVKPGENLKVDVSHSDVIITSGQVSEARVKVSVSGTSAEKAREFFEHLNFSVDRSAETITVRTDPRRNWRWNWGRTDVNVEITVPDAFNADVSVAHGDVNVNRLKGRLRFNTAHGDFQAGVLAGNSISIEIAHGDIDVDELHAEKLRLAAAHGEIEVNRIAAGEFVASNAHGDIDIRNAEGRAEVASSHGDIRVQFARSLEGEFSNSHGDIDLIGPRSAAADVEFEASDVELEGGYRFEGTQRRERMEGRINGGGPKLSARTTHGSISLRAN